MIEVGINFFDIVNMYLDGMLEEIVGCVLCDFVKCDDVVIVIKVFYWMWLGLNGVGLLCKVIMIDID